MTKMLPANDIIQRRVQCVLQQHCSLVCSRVLMPFSLAELLPLFVGFLALLDVFDGTSW